jgi:hypothetical protein
MSTGGMMQQKMKIIDAADRAKVCILDVSDDVFFYPRPEISACPKARRALTNLIPHNYVTRDRPFPTLQQMRTLSTGAE